MTHHLTSAWMAVRLVKAPSRSKVTVRSLRWRLILYCLRQLFCFVVFLSACGQTRRMGMLRQGSSLSWLSIRIRLQGLKPRESNKLFDLFSPLQDLSVQSVVKEKCSLRGYIHQFGVHCPFGVCLPYGITLVFSVKRRVLPTLPFCFASFL